MRSYAFLLLSISWTVVSSEDVNGLDKSVFQQVKDISKAYTEESFVKTVWSELSKSVPESARVPGVELSFKETTEEDLEENGIQVPAGTSKGKYWLDNYICTFESRIHPKLAEADSTKVLTEVDGKPVEKQEGRVVVAVDAKFTMNEKPMDYNIFQKVGGSNSAKGPIPVSYKFNEKSKVEMVLDIPDASKTGSLADADCLVNIRSLEVTEVSTPTLVNSLDIGDQEIAEYYWDIFAVKIDEMKVLMSIGLRRALSLKLKNEANYWLCLSDDLKKQVEKDEEQFKYKPIYDEYCKNAKIAD